MPEHADPQTDSVDPNTRELLSHDHPLDGLTDIDALLNGTALDNTLSELVENTDELSEDQQAELMELTELMKKAPCNAPESMKTGGSFEIRVASDKMSAELIIEPPAMGPLKITPQQIVNGLREQQVVVGIDAKRIARLVGRAQTATTAVHATVAYGQPVCHGQPARVKRFARLSLKGELQPIDTDQATENHNDESLFLCRMDDCLAVAEQPTRGEPGKLVTGQAIGSERHPPIELNPGRNVRRDGAGLLATIDGSVTFDGLTVHVDPVLVINQTVQPTSEPIRFDGRIVINADVMRGARVIATSDIQIEGTVEAATVISEFGNIMLNAGVVGKEQAIIKAAGDIQVHFAERATLTAGRDLAFKIGALNCHLTAGRNIQADRGQGSLAGGVIVAGREIHVKKLGAKGGLATSVCVGLEYSLLQQINKLDAAAAELRRRRADATHRIEQVELSVGDLAKLPPERLQPIIEMKKLCVVCDAKLRQLETHRNDLLEDNPTMYDGRLAITREVHDRVKLRIGKRIYELKPQVARQTLRRNPDTDQLTIAPA